MSTTSVGSTEILAKETWSRTPAHVIDFEGSTRTGIVEYGVATLLDGKIVAVATRLCAASATIPSIDTRCHGLRNSDLASAAPISDDWELFAGLRRTGFLCAHHAPTEHSLLKTVWPYPGAMPDHARVGDATATAINDWGPWLDTQRLAAEWFPNLPVHGLSVLVAHFGLEAELEQAAAQHCPPKRSRYHCALYDALAAALLLRTLCQHSGQTGITLEALVRISLGASRQAERMQSTLELW